MVQRRLEYVPALYKIFDEILVNAADNLVRCPEQDAIQVEVNSESGCISVWNNGRGLPVQMHSEHKVYVPELVFGQLLTSDNYDDSEKKVVAAATVTVPSSRTYSRPSLSWRPEILVLASGTSRCGRRT
jgi:DNA topoisomerase-2